MIDPSPPKSAQDLFDSVARHLFEQGRQSRKNFHGLSGTCAYRGEGRTACAVGCLLTDDEAAKADANAGTSVYAIFEAGLLPERLHKYLGLLNRLQMVHDQVNQVNQDTRQSFYDGLIHTAVEHFLEIDLLNEMAKQYGIETG